MDELKKYLHQHKENLDADVPGAYVWDKLQKELEPAKGIVVSLMLKWSVAACVILLAGFGVFVLINDKNKVEVAQNEIPVKTGTFRQQDEKHTEPLKSAKEQHSLALATQPKVYEAGINKRNRIAKTNNNIAKTAKADPKKMLDPISRAFGEMEAGYASMVNIQMEKIKGTPIYAEDAGYFHVFKKQFHDLNNDEKLLKQETKKTGLNDDVITRMINIYQEKITLLKQLQFEINKMNNRVKNSGNDVQKQSPTYINL